MEMIKLLLDNGADINATKNDDGLSTAVDLADRCGNSEVAEFLRQVEEGRTTGPDAAQAYIEEKETTTIRRVPLMVSKIVPTNCHACGAPFKGRAGDVCEYCGSVIEAKAKMHKVDG
jgi:rubrerythrin